MWSGPIGRSKTLFLVVWARHGKYLEVTASAVPVGGLAGSAASLPLEQRRCGCGFEILLEAVKRFLYDFDEMFALHCLPTEVARCLPTEVARSLRVAVVAIVVIFFAVVFVFLLVFILVGLFPKKDIGSYRSIRRV